MHDNWSHSSLDGGNRLNKNRTSLDHDSLNGDSLSGKSYNSLDNEMGVIGNNALNSSKEASQLQVAATNNHGSVIQREKFDKENTYNDFMLELTKIDDGEFDPEEKQEMKVSLLSEFHNHQKGLSISEIKTFGEQLLQSIREHEETDTLDDAFEENRVIYKSWHEPGRISDSINIEGGEELVGADYLNVALNPERFRNHKAQTKNPESGLAPIDAVPSSLLYGDREKNTVFNNDRGTATALLPENLYAGFNAFNETAKALLREKPVEELGDGGEALQELAKFMRAYVP